MKNKRCRKNTIDDLFLKLKLPSSINLSKDMLLFFIRSLKNEEYSTILYERYENGRSYGEIEILYDMVPTSCCEKCKSAIKQLRKDIINYFKPDDEKSINLYLHSDILKAKKFGSKSVKDVIEFLMEMDYRPSRFYDLVINTLQENGFFLIYPKYLLKSPEFPYNLYSHLLYGEGLRSKIPVKDLYVKYVKQISYYPERNLSAFIYHSKKIFSDENPYLTERQKKIGKYYYEDKISIMAIAFILKISETLVKRELHKIIGILNSEDGIYFIYHGHIKEEVP